MTIHYRRRGYGHNVITWCTEVVPVAGATDVRDGVTCRRCRATHAYRGNPS